VFDFKFDSGVKMSDMVIHLDEDTLGKANNETVLSAFMKTAKLGWFRILLYMALGWLVFGYGVKLLFALMRIPYPA